MKQTKTTERYTVHWWNGFKDLDLIFFNTIVGVNKMQTLFACHRDRVAIFILHITPKIDFESFPGLKDPLQL